MVGLIALATLLVPLAAGAALGGGVGRALGRRLEGVAAVLLALTLSVVGVVAGDVWHPVIGFWDAVTAGVLFGVGFVVAAHRAFADRGRLVSIAAGSVVGLVLLEIGTTLFLPPPPRFPTSAGVHFLLADAIRASREHQGWDFPVASSPVRSSTVSSIAA